MKRRLSWHSKDSSRMRPTDAQHPLVIDWPPSVAAQRLRHPSVAIPRKVKHDALDGIAQRDRFLVRPIQPLRRRPCLLTDIVPTAAETEPVGEHAQREH